MRPLITKAYWLVALALLALFAADAAHAYSRQLRAPVLGILTGNTYNGCMVKIGKLPTTSGLDCADNWVTLDCDGEWMDITDARNNLKSAQMALALNKRINITVDDRFATDRGDYCLAKQVILLK